MSTREIAYNIFQQLGERELQGFIALFSRAYPPQCDDMAERRSAFERIEKLRRHMPDLDEKRELAEYREEKYKCPLLKDENSFLMCADSSQ